MRNSTEWLILFLIEMMVFSFLWPPKWVLLGNFLGIFVVLVASLLWNNLVFSFRYSQIYKKYPKPKKWDRNLIVIGAGSGGLVTSYIAAVVKAKVTLIEKHKMGGDCLNTGCIPSKAFIRSAKFLAQTKRASEFGFRKVEVEFDFAEVMERVQRIIKTVEPHDSVERYTKLGVECIQGEAKIVSPFEVEVNGTILTSPNIVIATGARPFIPDIKGIEEIGYLTSDTIWNIKILPKRLLVLGGGPIGCELAQCFARLGSKVIQVQRASRLLTREDAEVSELLAKKFQAEGIELCLEHDSKEILVANGQKVMICQHQGKEVRLEFDEILVAVGRVANTKGFGLEELGIEKTAQEALKVNSFLETSYPNIYACGDVVGHFQFTHTAAHQAWFATVNALFGRWRTFRVDYSIIPWCTFTEPEVARVGLNEQEAKEAKIAYELSQFSLEELDRAITDEEAFGFVKVLTVPRTDQILGVTIVGEHAGDLISEFVFAMTQGLGLNKILGTIHIYPTWAEANRYVAGEWRRNHSSRLILKLLEKYHRWRRK